MNKKVIKESYGITVGGGKLLKSDGMNVTSFPEDAMCFVTPDEANDYIATELDADPTYSVVSLTTGEEEDLYENKSIKPRKEVIRLTESQLKELVSLSVKRVLDEI